MKEGLTVGELILIIIIIFLAANGDYTLLWIAGGGFVLILVASLFSGIGGKKTVSHERPRVRIDHPHYMTEDESECTICGRRIPAYASSCPNCGVRFNASREDEEEWDEEFDEECAWDEEEGW